MFDEVSWIEVAYFGRFSLPSLMERTSRPIATKYAIRARLCSALRAGFVSRWMAQPYLRSNATRLAGSRTRKSPFWVSIGRVAMEFFQSALHTFHVELAWQAGFQGTGAIQSAFKSGLMSSHLMNYRIPMVNNPIPPSR